jgi:hypothetical protein
MTKFWEDALDKFHVARKRLRPDAFLDTEYSDLVCDPIGVLRRLYSRLGRDLSCDVECRIRAFLSAHPYGKHGNHSYTLAAFSMDPAKLSERFRSYRTRFTGYRTRDD